MSLTFRNLGIPFALFEAPVHQAREYEGCGRCSLCEAEDVHRFRPGTGDTFRCGQCGTVTGYFDSS
jgi:hypothetical protein